MRQIKQSVQFRRDLKRELKGMYRNVFAKDGEYEQIKNMLMMDVTLPPKYRDHALHNNFEGKRECHLRHDLLLLYRYEGDDWLILEGLGSHSDLLGL